MGEKRRVRVGEGCRPQLLSQVLGVGCWVLLRFGCWVRSKVGEEKMNNNLGNFWDFFLKETYKFGRKESRALF